ncbi:MAG: 5-formyltetrahydrofolate cyclo-ligase [Frankiales bacterium]|jgi:5-formyltetrahydrofolate cyclo-ligase|nr:5-formyltetrahydrofolate cyclo-ligase [Frankiales bacterium]
MTTKASLRAEISQGRKQLSAADREQARVQIRRQVLAWCRSADLPTGARIAAYEPLMSEPGSIELLVELRQAGFEVIVPMTQPDRDLDWGEWTPTRQARQPLGLDAIAGAALVLVPALAVDAAGRRLGRGGGSYDRALARVAPGTPVAALLFSGELRPEVPHDEWDRPVSAVFLPEGRRELSS